MSLEQARADLGRVQARLAEQYPETDRNVGVLIEPLKETTVSSVRGSLWLLFGAVSVLLLIACTNIAALLLSRAARREQELSVRLSLGASRWTVAAQTLTETALLAVVGAVLGLLVAGAASTAVRGFVPEFPRIDEIALDGRVLLYTLLAIMTVTILCGLLPAIRSARRGRRRHDGRGAPHAGVDAPFAAVVVRRRAGGAVGRAACRRGVADPQLSRDLARRPWF